MKGDEGMSNKSGEYFSVMPVDEWVRGDGDPYSRSIVSRVVWPLETISSGDVCKTVKLGALFGWYGRESMRVQDLFISGHSGFVAGDQLLQGLESMQDFQFESAGEKEWGELSVIRSSPRMRVSIEFASATALLTERKAIREISEQP